MDDGMQARVSLRVANEARGTFAVPPWETLSAGRMTGYGLHIPHGWVPNMLCRFLPFDQGLVVQVGPSPRMRVKDRYTDDHTFAPRSMVVLQAGQSILTFPELDDDVALAVVMGPGVAEGLPEARDGDVVGQDRVLTRFAGRRVTMTPRQRRIVATAFRHLLLGEAAPANLATEASARLDTSPQVVKNTLGEVRKKVNLERWGPALEDNEQLGHYLVQLSGTITPDDLPDDQRR